MSLIKIGGKFTDVKNTNGTLSISGEFSRELGKNENDVLNLQLVIENLSTKVMKDFTVSFYSNKFGFLPSSESLFIYLNPKEKADVKIPMLPNRIVGGSSSGTLNLQVVLRNNVTFIEFTVQIPFDFLFVAQDSVRLTEAYFTKRWQRIEDDSEKSSTISLPSGSTISPDTLRYVLQDHNIYTVSLENDQSSSELLLSVKLLSGADLVAKLHIDRSNHTATCKLRTIATELCPYFFELITRLLQDSTTINDEALALLKQTYAFPTSEENVSNIRSAVPLPPLSLPSSVPSSRSSSPSSKPPSPAQPLCTLSASMPMLPGIGSLHNAQFSTSLTDLVVSSNGSATSDTHSSSVTVATSTTPTRSSPRAIGTSSGSSVTPLVQSSSSSNSISTAALSTSQTNVAPAKQAIKRQPSAPRIKPVQQQTQQTQQQTQNTQQKINYPPPPQRRMMENRTPSTVGSNILEWTIDKRSGTSFIGMGLLGFVAVLASMFVAWYAYPAIDEGVLEDRLFKPVHYSLPKNHIPRTEYQTLAKSFLQREVLGISVLTGPSGCGKTTALKALLNDRPLSIYFAMREVCDRALRIECFMRDFLSALGLQKAWGAGWLRAVPSVKTLEDLDLNELRWLYITGLRTLRTVLRSPDFTKKANKLGLRPVIVIDDAQFLIDLAQEGAGDDKYYGKGIIQELLNAGILISQEDSSANFIIVSNYDFSVRYFQRNYDGVQNGRLSEAEVNFGDAVKDVALSYLKKRASDHGYALPEEIFGSIYKRLGGRFADLSRVPLHNPDGWISVRVEELQGSIHHLIETNTSSWCTHAKVVKLLRLLQLSPGFVELDVARKEIDDPADLCIEQLVAIHIITRRNYGHSEDLSAIGATKDTFYLTAHSPLLQAVLSGMKLVLQLKVRERAEDESEARTIELQDIDMVALKRVISDEWSTIPERLAKIKSHNGRIEKNSHLLHLNHDDMLIVAFNEPTPTPTVQAA